MAYTTPYAPRERHQGRFDGTIADVIGRQGQMQAELLSRQGDMAAQRWGTIGQVIGQTAGAYLQDRRDEPYRQAQIESLRSVAADRDASAAQRSGAVRAAEQQSKQDEAFGSALQGWDGNPETLAKTAMTIYGPSGLDRAKTIWEGLQAFQVDPSQIKERFELVRAQARAIQALPDAARQGAYATMREQNISLGLLRPEDAPEAYTPDVVAQWANFDAQPKAPKAPFAVGGAVAIPDDNGGVTFQTPPQAPQEPARPVVLSEGAILVDPATGKQIAAGRPKSEPMGPQPTWQWVNRDGKELYTNRVREGDTPANARVKATEDERKTAGFYGQMSDAIAILNELEPSLAQQELYQIQTLPQEGLVGMANRGELSEAAKRYLRAFEQFTEARLRPVSGAAINDAEYARDRRTYAKQYAETPKLAADRRSARERALDSLRKRAGAAIEAKPTGSPSAAADGGWSEVAPGVKIREKR